MKKNDWIFSISAILFSILFYQQAAGLNYLLFSLLITGLILLFNPLQSKDPKWWYYAILTNITGAAVIIINSDLSVFACITSILALSGKSFNKDNSVLIGYLFGLFSVLSSFIYWIIELVSKKENENIEQKKKSRKIAGGVFIALLIAVVFFCLYREANPLFKDLTKYINFDWISIKWLFYTFMGFFIVRGLIKSKKINIFSDIEIKANRNILPESTNDLIDGKDGFGSSVIALSLFIILNIMLLFLNGLDVLNIYITQKLPAGIMLSDFVHQSVWSIVFSIIIAVTLIMWFFRADLNFSKQGKYIKLFVYFWIFQSAIMVINTMIRNYWYINGYQLTYLRIGVFVFLSLSLIGLILTVLKIAYQKSAWRLVCDNFEMWFCILALSALLNWDNIITNYNISHATDYKRLDKFYLLNLSDANIPQLVSLYNNQNSYTGKFNEEETYKFMQKIAKHAYILKIDHWQSSNLRRVENRKAIKNLKLQ